jgi:hypothetical protein
MPGHEIDGRGLDGLAAFAAQVVTKPPGCNSGGEDFQRSYRLCVASAAARDSRPNRLGSAGSAARSRTPASPIGGASYERGADASAIFEQEQKENKGKGKVRPFGVKAGSAPAFIVCAQAVAPPLSSYAGEGKGGLRARPRPTPGESRRFTPVLAATWSQFELWPYWRRAIVDSLDSRLFARAACRE